jgi:hypothetical protein
MGSTRVGFFTISANGLVQQKLYLELKDHLQSEHGHDWLQRLFAGRRKEPPLH